MIQNKTKKATSVDVFVGKAQSSSTSYNMKDAHASFSNGWKANGDISIEISVISTKPIIETLTYTISGALERPNEKKIIGDSIKITRSIRIKEEVFEIELLPYNETEVHTFFDEGISFKGHLDENNRPTGVGELRTWKGKNSIDIVTGVFDNFSITNGKVLFEDKAIFDGSLNISISSNDSVQSVSYTLLPKGIFKILGNNGMYSDKEDSVLIPIFRHFTKDTCYISNSEFSTFWNIDNNLAQKLSVYVNSTDAKVLLKTTISNNFTWKNSYFDKEPTFIYQNGNTIKRLSNNHYHIERYDGVSFEVNNEEITSFIKAYQEGILQYEKNGESMIMYKNGDCYKGTLLIDALVKESVEKQISSVIDASRINDFILYYVTGIYTYRNGKIDTWKKGITDYQKNKLAGNYDKVVAAVEENLHASVKDKAEYWEKVKPTLIKEFGADHVNTIYNYQLKKGIPFTLFERMIELKMPLFSMFGPITCGDSKNNYVLTIENRETGLLQYQRVLHFGQTRYPASKEFYLQTISTDF